MARYKHIDTSPRFIAVDLQRQFVPGTFEHALDYLIDHELDFTGFDGSTPPGAVWPSRASGGAPNFRAGSR